MVKKFYMETKDSTLESAILDVWKNAAENNMSGESSFEMGTDRYRDHTQGMTPGQQVEEALEMSDEDFDNLLETLTAEELTALDEGLGSWIQKRTGLGFGGKAKRAGHLQSKAKKASDKTKAIKDIDIAKADIRKARDDRKAYKADKKQAKKDAKAKAKGGDDEYTPGTSDEKTKTKKEPSSEKTKSDAPPAETGKAKDVATSADSGEDAAGGDEGKGGGGGADKGGNNDDAKGKAEPEKGDGEGGEGTPTGDKTDSENEDDPKNGKKKNTNGTEATAESYVPGYEYGSNTRLMSEQLAHVRMWQEAAKSAVNPNEREELDGSSGATGKGGVETAKKMKQAKKPAPNVTEGYNESVEFDEGSKEEYEKFFSSAMKKFKINSPSDLKSDEEKKKFFDYVDKNYKGEKSEELLKAVSEHGDWVNEKKLALAKEFKISSMRQALEKVWNVGDDYSEDDEVEEGGMKRVEYQKKSGEKGSGLKTSKPKPKEKKEEVGEELTIPQAQDFKVSSMRHALAQVWGLEEGELPPALKKAIDAKKKDGDEDEDKEESVKKGGKTETGKKMAEIEIDPELKEKNKK